MSTHIQAPQGAVADTVLLPGDPLRAKFIAENFLENAECYNEVRGMFGLTGYYKGKKVSVQGTGMGQPSLSIYVQELFQFYDVKNAIRIGTAGSVSENVPCRSIVIANSACSDSALQTQRFGINHFAPVPDFELLDKAYHTALELKLNPIVKPCVSSDRFYDERETWKMWKKYGAAAGLKDKITPHTLRRTFGTNLYEETGDIFLVSESLHHKSVETTTRHYVDSSKQHKRKAADIADSLFEDEE